MQVHLERTGLDQLPVVTARWFAAADARRWLGGIDPKQLWRLPEEVGGDYRGATITGVLAYLATVAGPGIPVAAAVVLTFDRWATMGPDGNCTVIDARPTATLALAVDPAWRERGIGAAMTKAIPRQPELAGIPLFVAAVETTNPVACRTVEAAGWHPFCEDPDWEGMLWYRFEPCSHLKRQ